MAAAEAAREAPPPAEAPPAEAPLLPLEWQAQAERHGCDYEENEEYRVLYLRECNHADALQREIDALRADVVAADADCDRMEAWGRSMRAWGRECHAWGQGLREDRTVLLASLGHARRAWWKRGTYAGEAARHWSDAVALWDSLRD